MGNPYWLWYIGMRACYLQHSPGPFFCNVCKLHIDLAYLYWFSCLLYKPYLAVHLKVLQGIEYFLEIRVFPYDDYYRKPCFLAQFLYIYDIEATYCYAVEENCL